VTSAEDFCCTCCGRDFVPRRDSRRILDARRLSSKSSVALVFVLSRTFSSHFPSASATFFLSGYIIAAFGLALRTRVSGERVISNYRKLDVRRYRSRYLESEAGDIDICVKEDSRAATKAITVRKSSIRQIRFFEVVFMNFHRSLRLHVRIIIHTVMST